MSSQETHQFVEGQLKCIGNNCSVINPSMLRKLTRNGDPEIATCDSCREGLTLRETQDNEVCVHCGYSSRATYKPEFDPDRESDD